LERSNAERKPWALDAGSFDSLLTALHGDRATAAAEYERMRQRLIRFFFDSAGTFSGRTDRHCV
jgi:hypothetical protein